MEFCKAFNAQTQSYEAGTPLPVVITAYADRTFSFIMKLPPVSYFLKQAAKISKGAGDTGRGASVGKVTMAQIREIAEKKLKDLNANDIDAASMMIVGSARSMGLEVV
jgi:large subunit ribosomal protein L11